MIAAIIFVSVISSFAGTTRYTYDDVNRVIREESGSGTPIINASAGSNGSISPSGTVAVAFGSNQTFAITPNVGYSIVDVKVDGASVGAVSSYTFNNVTAFHTIEALFAINTYQLTVELSNPGGGVVASSPAGINCGIDCSEIYAHGTSVTLTVTADIAYDFIGWTGACTGAGNCFITMDSAKNVIANFEIKKFAIAASVDAAESGTIAPSGNVIATYGGSQTFTMTSNIGYSIADVLVDGNPVGPVASYTFSNITANHTISVTFSCPNLPVKIVRTGATYTTLQAAYNAAATGDTIQSHAVLFTGNLDVNRDITVTLEGGYGCDYSGYTGSPTRLKGKLQTYPLGGKLTIKNFVLEK